ncbi:MAG: hypothetical protein IIU08_03170, partial [Clostridia bacterium]|nr:hypothetical protein [Clostridia bacterium]
MLHHWEEPPVSGPPVSGPDPSDDGHGSGAVFFTHCSLGCAFCQNGRISRPGAAGTVYGPEDLAEEFLKLESSGGNVLDDAAFEKELTAQGFPDSYKAALRTLHKKHPTWTFVADRTGLTWSSVIAAENVAGK